MSEFITVHKKAGDYYEIDCDDDCQFYLWIDDRHGKLFNAYAEEQSDTVVHLSIKDAEQLIKDLQEALKK
ncbi:MAG: hypothetical protein KAS32_16380 [Candidatus Peribacteraceae bacterium]|nr:hypothetical protein [Candidatus Peribacteraceae bacterium]